MARTTIANADRVVSHLISLITVGQQRANEACDHSHRTMNLGDIGEDR